MIASALIATAILSAPIEPQLLHQPVRMRIARPTRPIVRRPARPTRPIKPLSPAQVEKAKEDKKALASKKRTQKKGKSGLPMLDFLFEQAAKQRENKKP
ncbi:MAG: hypothetical protein QGF09_01580 [Rhodospirillales bacterium]|jgi:hypothetical protein|nr:hypothetical protein [Rhodospirillales bacterium]